MAAVGMGALEQGQEAKLLPNGERAAGKGVPALQHGDGFAAWAG